MSIENANFADKDGVKEILKIIASNSNMHSVQPKMPGLAWTFIDEAYANTGEDIYWRINSSNNNKWCSMGLDLLDSSRSSSVSRSNFFESIHDTDDDGYYILIKKSGLYHFFVQAMLELDKGDDTNKHGRGVSVRVKKSGESTWKSAATDWRTTSEDGRSMTFRTECYLSLSVNDKVYFCVVGNHNDKLNRSVENNFATVKYFDPDGSSSSGGDLSSFTGVLPVANGGTGRTSFTNRNLLVGNDSGGIGQIAPKAGALYVPTEGEAARYGTLPINMGGTGATTVEGVLSELGIASHVVDEGISYGSNWRYIKFSNGDVILHKWFGNVTVTGSTAWSTGGAYYSSNNALSSQLPFDIEDFNYVAMCNNNVCFISNAAYDSSTKRFTAHICSSHQLDTTTTYNASVIIMGRWK